MPTRVELSVSPELLATQDDNGVLKQASRAFAHSLIQSPINGVVQLYDNVRGTNALPSVQLIDAPKEAAFGTKEWHAQQIGQAAGMLPWFVALHKGSSAALGRAAGLTTENVALKASENFLSRKTAVEVGASAFSGLTFGALLTPTKPGEDFLRARAANAASSALTFATLATTMRGLNAVGLRSDTAAGFLSGIPAGAVAAESHSLLAGKGHASLQDIGRSVYGFSLIGGGFGFVQGRLEARPTSPERTSGQAKVENAPTEVSSVSDGRTGLRAEAAPIVEARIGALPTKPAELTTGHEIVVLREGQPTRLEVAATTERMVVLKEPNSVASDRSHTISAREFENLTPVEITVGGKPETRYIHSSNTQLYSNVYKAEIVGDRYRLTADSNFSACNRPEMFQWVRTPHLRSGADGAPSVDWSIVPEMRAKLGTELPARSEGTSTADQSVYTGVEGSRARWQEVSLSSRGDTLASVSEASGLVVLEKPGQPWVAEMKDGRCITMESPGPWEAVTPASKRVITKDSDGHVTIHDWTGNLLHSIRNPEAPQYVIVLGTSIPVMERLPQGTPPRPLHHLRRSDFGPYETLWLSDGTRLKYPNNGRWEGTRPDGSTFTPESAGPWQIVDRGGTHVSKDAAGVVRHSRDGFVTSRFPDGTCIREGQSASAGVDSKPVTFTETTRPGQPDLKAYEDPAVPGQRVTQILRFSEDAATRINASEFDWEASRADGSRFTYDSPGPWEVSLLNGKTIAKDAAGNLRCADGWNTSEFRANGDKIFTDGNSTTIYKTDRTKYTLYRGCTRWLKETPDGKRTEVDHPEGVEPTPAPRSTAPPPPVSDPFDSDYW